jgi:DNA-binding IclR family transcriptional regulator
MSYGAKTGERTDMFAHAVKLLKHEPRTVPDLMDLVGCHQQSARRWVKALEDHGLIVRDGKVQKHLGQRSGKPSVLWRWQ